jgi:hypothetical protein
MSIFLIAILISFVLILLSSSVLKFYLSLNKTDEELGKSFFFNAAVLMYLINTGLIFINSAVLVALVINTYLL